MGMAPPDKKNFVLHSRRNNEEKKATEKTES
jgi:hypothetical protein